MNRFNPKTGEEDEDEKEISYITDFDKKLNWSLKRYMVTPILVTDITLKIKKAAGFSHEVQIG